MMHGSMTIRRVLLGMYSSYTLAAIFGVIMTILFLSHLSVTSHEGSDVEGGVNEATRTVAEYATSNGALMPALSITMTVAIYLLANTLGDFYLLDTRLHKDHRRRRKCFISQFAFVFAMIAPEALPFLIYSAKDSVVSFEHTFWHFLCLKEYFLLVSNLEMVHLTSQAPAWSRHSIISLVVLGGIVSCFKVSLGLAAGEGVSRTEVAFIVLQIFLCLALCIKSFQFCYWIAREKMRGFEDRDDGILESHAPADNRSTDILSTCIICTLFSSLLIIRVIWTLERQYDYLSFVWLNAIFCFLVSLVSGRHFALDTFLNKAGLKGERTDFFRYVNHEIRTPLNSLSMALAIMENCWRKEHNTRRKDTPPDHVGNDDGRGDDAMAEHESLLASPSARSTLDAYSNNTTTNNIANVNSINSINSDDARLTKSSSSSSNSNSLLDTYREEMLRLLPDARSSCDLAVDILNDLLFYEKSRESVQLEKRTQSLVALVSEALGIFSSRAENAGVAFKLVIDQDLVTTQDTSREMLVTVDSARILTVMRNLLSNAIKFCDRGDTVQVRVFLHSDFDGRPHMVKNIVQAQKIDIGTHVRVEVQDCGRNTSTFKQAVFFRKIESFDFKDELHGGGMGGGTGLGLHISHLIIKSHGGILRGYSLASVNQDMNSSSLYGRTQQGGGGFAVAAAAAAAAVFKNKENESPQVFFFDLPVQGSPMFGIAASSDTAFSSNLAGQRRRGPYSSFMGVAMSSPVSATARGVDSTNNSFNLGSFNLGSFSIGSFASNDSGDELLARGPARSWRSFDAPAAGGGGGGAALATAALAKKSVAEAVAAVSSTKNTTPFSDKVHDSTEDLLVIEKQQQLQQQQQQHHQQADFLLERTASLHIVDGKEFEQRRSTPPESSTRSRSSKVAPSPNAHSSLLRAEKRCYTNLRVLIVDDATSNRKMLARMLQVNKYITTYDDAVNGSDAVEKIRLMMDKNDAYDVVFMDYVMPILDGPSATKMIRQLGYVGLIFGLTGNAHSDDFRFFLSNGVNAVFAKPFNMEEFQRAMDDFYNEKAVEKEV